MGKGSLDLLWQVFQFMATSLDVRDTICVPDRGRAIDQLLTS